ncbi:hypothetical protein [Bordetella pertussis]|nr:hypothetical protein [Bordetella pertussis]
MNHAYNLLNLHSYATDPRYAEKLISIMGQLRTSVARADFSGGL